MKFLPRVYFVGDYSFDLDERIKLYGTNIRVEFKPLERGIWFNTDFIEHEINPDKIDINYV